MYHTCINISRLTFGDTSRAQLAPFTGKERIGRVTVERFRDSISLRWKIAGKSYSLTIGKDSKEAVKVARAKAQTIDSNITMEQFDPSLEKYGRSKSTVLEVVSPIQDRPIALRELWDKFLADKLPHLKAKTQDEYVNFTHLLVKIDKQLSYDGLATKQAILAVTTTD